MVEMNIGVRLKRLRKEAGFSQRELARRSGVTNGFISQVEKNQVSPSVASLKKLLGELPMSLADFFAEPSDQQSSFYCRQGQHPDIGRGEISYQLIGHFRENRAICMLHEVLHPGADSGAEMLSHKGEECGVVVRGILELTVDDEVVLLSQGDSYYFDSHRSHRFRNIGDQDCEVVSANTPPSF
ncbi:MAG: HTH-type transcriptional regulator PuuR [Candidatus Celerinatantimonas neptuna]|nr:MAG: HTH-type transcriptional regulator PuuR [Candidatus Celerinatantimonas neptuna]